MANDTTTTTTTINDHNDNDNNDNNNHDNNNNNNTKELDKWFPQSAAATISGCCLLRLLPVIVYDRYCVYHH